MITDRALTWLLAALAIALTANAVLGPLAFGVIEYHYGEAMINQAIGLDAVALVFAAPLAVAAAILVARDHPAGPALAFAPATFAAYMMPQYVVGPDYLGLPGNNEHAIPLHIATMVLAIAIAIRAWRQLSGHTLPPDAARSDRRRGWILVGLAGFTAIGRWVPSILDALGDEPSTAYLDNPTAFWLVGVLDLGIVVPAAIATAVAVDINGHSWAPERVARPRHRRGDAERCERVQRITPRRDGEARRRVGRSTRASGRGSGGPS